MLTLVTETAGEEDQRLEGVLAERSGACFDVVRRGVSDTAVRMRFGRCLWQDAGSGTKRHNLSRVADEGRAESEPPAFALLNEPQLSRTTESAVASARALAVLLDELQAQGVLAQDIADKVRAAAVPHQLTAEEGRQFDRADDLDQCRD